MQSLVRKRILATDDIDGLDCRKCNKSVVCTLYRGIGTLIGNNWQGEAKPFQPHNTAMICKHFDAGFGENL
jgi:hypothetical protein